MREAARVTGIVLAAGSSTRMGRNKMLLHVAGEPLVRRAVRAALDAGLDPVLVVLGHESERVREAIAGLECRAVLNADHAQGVRVSMQAGVRAVPEDASAAVVILADMPFVTADMIRAVADRYRAGDAPLVVSAYGDVNAPPTLYDRALFGELLASTGEGCGKQVVRRHQAEAAVVAWPEAALFDVDAPEDYEQASSQLADGDLGSLGGSLHDLLQLAAVLAQRGEPFAMATVVNREPPVSSQVGDVAIITRDGAFHGWVGGSCTQPTVIAEAARVLADGRPRFIALAPEPAAHGRPGLTTFPMTCHSGGSVEIYIQPVLPAPRLVVFGISPTARALARLAAAMGYGVVAVDPHADAAAFPQAERVFTDAGDPDLRAGTGETFAVVATQGQWDEDAVLAAAGLHPAYLAVVASPKRFGEMRTVLAARLEEPALRAIRNPAGLDLGARGPEEVALSILAEVVKERRAARRALPVPPAAQAGSGQAKDPICGMSVAVQGARHRAEHEGREYFFCCAGCREKFLAAPERYAAAVAGGR
jgi:xanthine dehydrogenase accessory factor